MDLDDIKKKWQESEIKPAIDEDKIKRMLNNEGQSAFNSLLRYEKCGIVALFLCIPIGYFIFYRYLPVAIIFSASCLAGLFWQVYKYRKLKKVNTLEMGITEIACHFYWYRKVLLKELYTGLVWFVFFFIIFGYFELLHDAVYFHKRLFILIASMITGIIFALLMYRILYWKNMKKLEASIKEIEEFGKENQE